MKSLPIGPEEAFVLSRVDGSSSEADIVACTGLDGERVTRALRRLAELGAISFGDASVASAAQAPVDSNVRAGAARAAEQGTAPPPSASSQAPPARTYDRAELEEVVDLDLDRKQQILEVHSRLDRLTHYELLGVNPDADKKTIKQAYYETVAVFHPDRYFGKNLGSFKPKLEKVFARMTQAHDTLTPTRARAEYDQYLAARQRTRVMERQLSDEQAQAAELESVRHRIREQARRAAENPSVPEMQGVRLQGAVVEVQAAPPAQPSSGSEAPSTSQAPARAGSGPTPSIGPARPAAPRHQDSDGRRKALARKLGTRVTSAPPADGSVPPLHTGAAHEHAAQDLRRRYERRLVRERQAQLQRYVEAADQALESGNAPAAANALRIAVSLAPDDLALVARLEEVQNRAATELADTYENQARYEERSGRLEAAAQSYAKAARGKPSARLHERAALCLLEAGGDVRAATEHARQALSLDPNNARVRLTLARAYLASNLRQSAIAELERAAALAPEDETIKDWRKRAKRSQI
jgi:tetratricopeptide (TPR) repeat protein